MTTYVFIPGLLSDERVWRHTANALGGQNMTADLSQDATIEGMATRALDAVAGDMIVIGHSLGGRVAMEMAHQAPDRVRGLVLANTGHNALQPGELEKRQAKIDLGHADMPGLARDWLPPMVAPDRAADATLIADLTEMVLAKGPDIHERQINALISRPDAGAYCPQIACPVLLMTGTEDGWSPEPQHREIAEMVQNGTLHIIEGAGHFMPIEQPEHTTQIIRDWLENL